MPPPVPPPVSPTDRWKAWDNFLQAKSDTGFMQSSWWADFRTAVGYEHFATILKDKNGIVGGAMVQKFSYTPEECFYYIQDGPALPDDEPTASEVFEAILDAIEERRQSEQQIVSHLRIEPQWRHLPRFVLEQGFAPPPFSDSYREPRNTLYIDLRPAEAEILAQMHPKGRYNIRVAQRHGISVVEDSSAQGLADFSSIYEDMARRQEIATKPPDYFDALVSILLPLQQGAIFFAEHEGARLAAALVIYFGPRATYFYGGSLDIHRHVMAPYLLHFEIMRKAGAMGLEWYDLWGVAPQNAPDHPWQNISVFKRKFGGLEITLVPTLDLVYDRVAYEHYIVARGHYAAAACPLAI